MESLPLVANCSHTLDERGAWRVNKYYVTANLAGKEVTRHFWLDGEIADGIHEWSFTFDGLEWCGNKDFSLTAKIANHTVELLSLKNVQMPGNLPLMQVEKGFTWAKLGFDPKHIRECARTKEERTVTVACFGKQFQMSEHENLKISGLLPMTKTHKCNVTEMGDDSTASIVTFETRSDLPPVAFTAHDSAVALVSNQPDFVMAPASETGLDCHVTVTNMANNVTKRATVNEAITVGVTGLKPNGHYRACLVMQERPQQVPLTRKTPQHIT